MFNFCFVDLLFTKGVVLIEDIIHFNVYTIRGDERDIDFICFELSMNSLFLRTDKYRSKRIFSKGMTNQNSHN